MVKADTKIDFPGKSASEVYTAGISLAEQAGYKILKKRPTAYLLTCETQVEGRRVSVNMAVPFPTPHTLTINLQSEELGDAALLQAELQRLTAFAAP
jgi:hypothetical protein